MDKQTTMPVGRVDNHPDLRWEVLLYRDIIGARPSEADLPEDLDAAVEQVVSRLSPADQKLITLRYQQRKTFAAIAEELHLNTTQVWREFSMMLRRIGTDSNRNLFLYGLKGATLHELERRRLQKEQEAQLQELAELQQRQVTDLITGVFACSAPNFSVLEMDLPTRVRNALLREKIRDVYDLAVHYGRKRTFTDIRSIGLRGEVLILEEIRKHGDPVTDRQIPEDQIRAVSERKSAVNAAGMTLRDALKWLQVAERVFLPEDTQSSYDIVMDGKQITLSRQAIQEKFSAAVGELERALGAEGQTLEVSSTEKVAS